MPWAGRGCTRCTPSSSACLPVWWPAGRSTSSMPEVAGAIAIWRSQGRSVRSPRCWSRSCCCPSRSGTERGRASSVSAPRSPVPCCAPAPRSASWRPAGSRSGSGAKPYGDSTRSHPRTPAACSSCEPTSGSLRLGGPLPRHQRLGEQQRVLAPRAERRSARRAVRRQVDGRRQPGRYGRPPIRRKARWTPDDRRREVRAVDRP